MSLRPARLGLLVALLAAAFSPARAQTPPKVSVQEAILRAKPAVALVAAEVGADVRVNCGRGETVVAVAPFRELGTAWVIDADGWLITNGHMVQPAHAPPPWLMTALARRAAEAECLPIWLQQRGVAPGQRRNLEEQLKGRIADTVVPNSHVAYTGSVSVMLSNGARHLATVKKYSPPVAGAEMSGRDLALLKIDATNLPVLALAGSEKTLIGDAVHILGFPGVVLTHELLKQSAMPEASVTNGAVSGFKADVADNPVIQTDAPAGWGNSGGPAINSAGRVIGVLTFVSVDGGREGNLVQGFNFIIPVAAVRDFMQGVDARLNGTSTFNEAWWSGLREFFSENYRGAVPKFEAANRIHPNFPDVKRLLGEARERPTALPWAMIAVGITVLSVGLYGVLLTRRWQRNRFRIGPAEVVRLIDESGGDPPVLLDVRASSAYEHSPLRIPNAVRITPKELESGITALKIEPTRTVVAYCT